MVWQRQILAVVTVLLAAMAVPPAAHAAVVAQVLAAEDARFAAMVQAEPARLRPWLAADLYYVHSTGAVEGRDEFLAAIGSHRVRYHAIEPIEREVVPLSRSAALVRGVARITVSASGAPLDLRIRYLALYGRSGGIWQLRAWQSLQLTPR